MAPSEFLISENRHHGLLVVLVGVDGAVLAREAVDWPPDLLTCSLGGSETFERSLPDQVRLDVGGQSQRVDVDLVLSVEFVSGFDFDAVLADDEAGVVIFDDLVDRVVDVPHVPSEARQGAADDEFGFTFAHLSHHLFVAVAFRVAAGGLIRDRDDSAGIDVAVIGGEFPQSLHLVVDVLVGRRDASVENRVFGVVCHSS